MPGICPDPTLFRPESISADTLAANEAFWKATSNGPDWWVVGAPAYREAAARGKGAFLRPEKSARARTIQIGFRAASLAYGNFDASMTPSQSLAPDKGYPIALVGRTCLEKYVEAFLPAGMNPRDPEISPLYADVQHMPASLFTVGTIDPLLDDTLFMHARWIAAGNEAELALYPGAPHAFNSLKMPQGPAADARIDSFLRSAIS